MLRNTPPPFDFGLGETADMLRETVRASPPTASRRSPTRSTATNWFPRELWPEMGALGLHGITVAEEDGGAGLGYLEHCVAMEEISRASGSVGLSYGAHSNLCVNQISPQRQRRAEAALSAEAHLRRASRRARDVGAGRRLGRRVDAAARREARRPLHAERHENSGSPTARRPTRSSSTPRPIRRPARAASPPSSSRRASTGFSVAQKLDKLGMRGSETGELVFQDCEVPEENVLGAGRARA